MRAPGCNEVSFRAPVVCRGNRARFRVATSKRDERDAADRHDRREEPNSKVRSPSRTPPRTTAMTACVFTMSDAMLAGRTAKAAVVVCSAATTMVPATTNRGTSSRVTDRGVRTTPGSNTTVTPTSSIKTHAVVERPIF
jgi:hypothetical protein